MNSRYFTSACVQILAEDCRLQGLNKGGESLFSLLCIIPVMFLVSGGCDLLKSDILDACYSQVKRAKGRGKPYHSEKGA